MKTIKGPAIFLAQFAGDAVPFNSLAGIAGWAAGHGYKGVQIAELGRASVRSRSAPPRAPAIAMR